MRIWGQFRDLENSENFVWLRGYRSMKERQAGLLEFYTSALWKDTGPTVRDMLAERATHVHFLEPVTTSDGFRDSLVRAETGRAEGVVVVQVFLTEDNGPLIRHLRDTVIPGSIKLGAKHVGLFRASKEANNFPALPFIENEAVVVWIATYQTKAVFRSVRESLRLDPEPFETFVLEPGARSRLYHRGD